MLGKGGNTGPRAQTSSNEVSSGDLVHIIGTILNNTVLHTSKLLRKCILRVLTYTHKGNYVS